MELKSKSVYFSYSKEMDGLDGRAYLGPRAPFKEGLNLIYDPIPAGAPGVSYGESYKSVFYCVNKVTFRPHLRMGARCQENQPCY